MSFDLRGLIREVCDTTDYTDPGLVAKEVDRRIITAEDRESALQQSLRTVVHHVISTMRVPLASHDLLGADRGAQDENAGEGDTPSRKVAGIRDVVGRGLRNRLNVGPNPGDYKFFGDCGVSDLDFAATMRENAARLNAAAAVHLREVITLLEHHQVPVVRELPIEVLRRLFGVQP